MGHRGSGAFRGGCRLLRVASATYGVDNESQTRITLEVQNKSWNTQGHAIFVSISIYCIYIYTCLHSYIMLYHAICVWKYPYIHTKYYINIVLEKSYSCLYIRIILVLVSDQDHRLTGRPCGRALGKLFASGSKNHENKRNLRTFPDHPFLGPRILDDTPWSLMF